MMQESQPRKSSNMRQLYHETSDIIMVGLATFTKLNFQQNRLQDVLDLLKMRILQEDHWKWYNEQFSQQWVRVFQLMDEAYCAKLIIKKCPNGSFLKPLCYPKFVCLKSINFEQNNIANIESLTFLNLEHLCQLKLSKNKIANIKPLNKLHCPKIRIFQIQSNPLAEIDISRMMGRRAVRMSLHKWPYQQNKDGNLSFDMAKTAKWFQIEDDGEETHFSSLEVMPSIIQPKVFQILSERFATEFIVYD